MASSCSLLFTSELLVLLFIVCNMWSCTGLPTNKHHQPTSHRSAQPICFHPGSHFDYNSTELPVYEKDEELPGRRRRSEDCIDLRDHGTFTSRGFSLNGQGQPNGRYANDELMCWRLSANNPFMAVELHFEFFELEAHTNCSYDAVVLIEGGLLISSKVMYFLCGSGVYQDFTSTSDQMIVFFSTDGSITASGFKARFRTVENPQGPMMRLRGGPADNLGLLEVTLDRNTWGPVCEDGFTETEARVACRGLGYTGAAVHLQKTPNMFNVEFSTLYPMLQVVCDGHEVSLHQCAYRSYGGSCTVKGNVGVMCTNEDTIQYGGIRLTDEAGADGGLRGRLEINFSGIWGTVCNGAFNDDDAEVACRELGYTGGMVQATPYVSWVPIWLDDAYCGGEEDRLVDCYVSTPGSHDCVHTHDVSLTCLPAEELSESSETQESEEEVSEEEEEEEISEEEEESEGEDGAHHHRHEEEDIDPETGCINVSEERIIRSPGYAQGQMYPLDSEFCWVIVAPSDNVVKLQFSHFDVEYGDGCAYDAVNVYDGDISESDGELMDEFCGSETPPDQQSQSNMMTIELISDNVYNARGFEASVTFVMPVASSAENEGEDSMVSETVSEEGSPEEESEESEVPETESEETESLETESESLETESESLETESESLETESESLDTESESLETESESLETESESPETESESPETESESLETESESPETESESSASEPESPESEPESPETVSIEEELPENESPEEENSHMVIDDGLCDAITEAGILTVPDNWDSIVHYETNEEGCWYIEAPQGMKVRLTFEAFDVEEEPDCNWDYVDIYNGHDTSDEDQRIAHLCGEDPPEPVISEAEEMSVVFRSDEVQTKTGFNAVVEFVADEQEFPEECELITSPGTINMPEDYDGDDNRYDRNVDACWVVQAPEGQVVSITFNGFEIQSDSSCDRDWLDVYEGVTGSDLEQRLHRLCGSDPPEVIVSDVSSLYLGFHSDGSGRRRGFSANVQFVDQEGSASEDGCTHLYNTASIASHDSEDDFRYPNNLNLCWVFTVPEGELARITFVGLFNIERHSSCGFDSVSIYSGSEEDESRLLATVCGTTPPGSYTSTDNQLYITFTTDYTGQKRGFTAELTGVEHIPRFDCGFRPVDGEIGQIIEGDRSYKGQWPWTVDITVYSGIDQCSRPLGEQEYSTYAHVCGGTIIHPYWVVTAAHCVFEPWTERHYPTNYFRLRMGEHSRTVMDSDEVTYTVAEIITHEGYEPVTPHTRRVSNDIALLKLNERIEFTDYIQPICLHHHTTAPAAVGDECYIAGWGSTKNDEGEVTGDRCVLAHVTQTIRSSQSCLDEGFYHTSKQLCASHDDSRGACMGDSGSGLVCHRPDDNLYYLDGITSFGYPGRNDGCRTDAPIIYTNITRMYSWILEHTQEAFNMFLEEEL